LYFKKRTDSKRKVASDVVDSLLEVREKNLGDIRRLLNEISKINKKCKYYILKI